MTELDTREDDWARGVFDRAHRSLTEPHWIPDAAAAARVSTRRRRRTRAAGALATAAVVGVSATAFATLSGTADHNGQQTVTPASTVHSTPSPATEPKPISPLSSVGTYLSVSAVATTSPTATTPPKGLAQFPATAVTTLGTVLSGIDPALTHVRSAAAQVATLDIGPGSPGLHDVAVKGQGYWTPDGDIAPLRADSPHDPSKPFGYVTIAALGKDQLRGPGDDPKVACGLGSALFMPTEPVPTTWSACTRQTQSDGSVIVSSHSVGLAAGEVHVAAREFPDGSAVAALISSFVQYDHGHSDVLLFSPAAPRPDLTTSRALNPVPWTDDTLVKALSGQDVKGLP